MQITLYALFMVLSLALFSPDQVFANGGGGSTIERADPAIKQANQAIKEKDWSKAIEILNAAVFRDNSNAEAYNLLGYSERMSGNLDAAFERYERALVLDPEHRGAHEYIGEAYLIAGNLPKAEEHLHKLDKLCFFPCEEYTDLKVAVANYKAKHP